ncbi:MAG: excinuclease ABC subunit C, partial [Alistipes sp.]|nr:excinuclease ABC subunit C [Alistipes sp.]
ITFHRQKRTKAMIHSELENIEGIGEKSIATLLRAFRTVANIRKASTEELAEVVGQSKAKKIEAALS